MRSHQPILLDIVFLLSTIFEFINYEPLPGVAPFPAPADLYCPSFCISPLVKVALYDRFVHQPVVLGGQIVPAVTDGYAAKENGKKKI